MSTSNPPLHEHEVAALVADNYGLGTPTSIELLRAHGNDTYEVRIGTDTYALRIRGQHNWWISGVPDLRFEVDLLDHLAAHHVPVSTGIPRVDGDTIGELSTDTGPRYYTLFTWAPGQPGSRAPEGARLVGKTLASIHLASDSFTTSHHRYHLDETTMLDRRLPDLEHTLAGESPSMTHYIHDQIAEIRGLLHRFDPGPGGWGIIHGDVQELNFHIADSRLTFFDFDLCAWGWRTSDIAEYYTRIPPPHRQPFLEGYQTIRPLNPTEHDMLLTVARLAWIREGCQGATLARMLNDPFMAFGQDDGGRWRIT